ncbi:MAG: hypothetical protein KDE57_15975 [Calditrichaeota bacterium]|nr:hypothetical protein [Calditrichota bacterium]
MSKILILFVLLNLSGWFVSCDSDRYLSYNFTAESPAKVAQISGTITNLYTGQAVDNAQIIIDTQIAETESNGEYLLNFILGGDESFNRSYDVRITADEYYPLDTAIVVFPNLNRVCTRGWDALPVVVSAELVEPAIARATILDYQGISSVDTVTVLVAFLGAFPNSNKLLWLEYPLIRTQVINEKTARYETVIEYDNGILLFSKMRVIARDNEGFVKNQIFLFDTN